MKIRCSNFIAGKGCGHPDYARRAKLKLCRGHTASCYVKETKKSVSDIMEALRPDCTLCEYWEETDISDFCQNCFWRPDSRHNFKNNL